MTEEYFISQIWENIVKENFNSYDDILEETNRETVTDDYWKNVLSLYDSLDEEQKSIIKGIIKQTFVDSLSNFLGLLDGKYYLEEQEEDFELFYNKEKLNGFLSDGFLEKAEENGF